MDRRGRAEGRSCKGHEAGLKHGEKVRRLEPSEWEREEFKKRSEKSEIAVFLWEARSCRVMWVSL